MVSRKPSARARLTRTGAALSPARRRRDLIRSGNDESPQQLSAEGCVSRSLGMPLHTHVELAIASRDAFDHSIGGARDDGEMPRIGDALMVVTMHRPVTQIASHAVELVAVVIGGRRPSIRQVLIESSAGMEGHHLHAKANSEHGFVRSIIQREKKSGFKGLSVRMNERDRRMHRLPVRPGVRVITA